MSTTTKISENFIQSIIDIGVVKEFSVNPAIFYKKPGCKQITGMQAGCQCTEVSNETNFIMTRYHAGEVPEQNGDSAPISKGISITFVDGTRERLKIVGTLIKK